MRHQDSAWAIVCNIYVNHLSRSLEVTITLTFYASLELQIFSFSQAPPPRVDPAGLQHNIISYFFGLEGGLLFVTHSEEEIRWKDKRVGAMLQYDVCSGKKNKSLEKRIDEKKLKKTTKSLTSPPFLACCVLVFILVHTTWSFDLHSPPPLPCFQDNMWRCGGPVRGQRSTGPRLRSWPLLRVGRQDLTQMTSQPTLLLNSRGWPT